MLTNIRLRNMKALKDTGDLNIKPLTLLIGPNSAGKSTVLQALLMIKQTVDSRDLGNPLAINGPWVEMGSFRDMIRGRDTDGNLDIDLSFSTAYYPESVWELFNPARFPFKSEMDTQALGRILKTHVEFNETSDSRISPKTFSFSYNLNNAVDYEIPVLFGSVFLQEDDKHYTCKINVPAEGDRTGFTDYEWSRPDAKFYDVLTWNLLEMEEEWPVVWTQSLNYDFERAFSSFHYLGPLRARPQRVYNVSGETPQDVGHAGERFADVLISARSGALEAKVDEWMAKFDIAAKVTLEQMGPGFFYVQLTNPFTKVPVNLADAGFGGSQVIPIIVEGFFAQEDALILLEQPEIHLHPRAQGVLGDLLVDIAKEERRLIVETHSEHMLGRIQTNIAEGSIAKDDVAVYYFQPSETGTRVRELVMDDNGQFESEGLPDDFFTQGYNESMRQMNAIAGKMRRVSSAG